MVSRVFFDADVDDTVMLLSYLGFGFQVSLHPWPLVQEPLTNFTTEQALAAGQVVVRSRQLGGPFSS